MWKKLLFPIFLGLGPVWGQTVLQAGPSAPGHAPMYVGAFGQDQVIIQDSGPASGGGIGVGLSELGLTVQGTGTPPYANAGSGPFGANLCDYDAPINNPTGYHFICFSPNSQGGAAVIAGAAGGASPLPLNVIINGVIIPFVSGTGTVTNVAETFTGGIISVAGSPITTSGTFALTVAGTSGGIPYFSSASAWASSGALAAYSIVLGGGAGAAPTDLADVAAGSILVSGGVAANPAYSTTPTLGASGTVGTLAFGNATSGTITLGTVTGALGTVTASLPDNSGIIAELNLAQTFSAATTFSAPVASTSTTLPTQAAGLLGIAGETTTPTLGASAEGDIYILSSGGVTIIGNASPNDFTLLNSSGTAACILPDNTIALTCGAFTVTGATAAVNGLYLPTTNTVGISANSTEMLTVTATVVKAIVATASSSTTTGALQSAGGLGIAGAAYIGTTLNIGTIPTSAGGGGLYVCIDTSGNTYKKSACP